MLLARLTTKIDRRKLKDGQLTSYRDLVNYLLRTYATEEVIAEADVAINQFHQGDRVSPPEYAQKLWSKELKCATI